MESPGTLEVKLQQLEMTIKRTGKILEAQKYEAIERHQASLKATAKEVDHWKREVEARKIAEKVEVSEIEEWIADIEGRMESADHEISRLQTWKEDFKKENEQNQQEEELKFERELHETRMKFKAELQAISKENAENKTDGATGTLTGASNTTQGIQAKLPKLEITPFDGSYQDWNRFWGQFTETIDKTNIPNVTKFSYMREMLNTNVKRTVEALPFTSEGYNRAKSILQEKYGKPSEIIKAYTKKILDLPIIPNANVKRIHEFYDKLMYCVQSLQTMGTLDKVNGNVAMTLDKLPGIRGDLVRTDPEWENWDFVKLVEALSLWTRRNPIDNQSNPQPTDAMAPARRNQRPTGKLYHARRQESRPRGCVYCDDTSHRSSECSKVTTISERRQILAKRHLCFNCAVGNHRAAECPSKNGCQHCDRRHHSSICDRTTEKSEKEILLTTNKSGEGVFPVVTVRINGVKCRALIDSGAGSSYASAKLIHVLNAKPVKVQNKQIDMLMCTKQVRLETYHLKIESLDREYEMKTNLIKINKSELLSLDNPHYQDLLSRYSHLKGVAISDHDDKPKLPVHVVLGNGEYARIKTETVPRVGRDCEPIAELTKLGWFLMSPGQEFDRNRMMVTQTSQLDYEELCRLDVLGLEDTDENDQQTVYREFKEQLVRSEDGWYETGLPWRGNHPPLPDNKQGSLRRLSNLSKKLERLELTSEYEQIIMDQKSEGIVEPAPEQSTGQEFYIPHKPVIRESAQSTKLRIVYDASARATPNAPSLNECLHPGPVLQNKLWDVLVRQRYYPVAINGDIQKAFLQIRIKEQQRDALRFHWQSNEHSNVETYRFTRALFGLTSSPFLLGGVIEQHLETWSKQAPEIVAELRKSLYVDDLLMGAQTVEEAQAIKCKAIEIFDDAKLVLHKWNSNVKDLEDNREEKGSEDDLSFAKEHLGVKMSESKLLGVQWDKEKDDLSVVFPQNDVEATKRGVLSKLAKIYDPLGLASPLTLQGKLIYRDICKLKIPWDVKLSGSLIQRWSKWVCTLPDRETVPRSITDFHQPVLALELHAFGDASTQGVGAVVYSVIQQQNGTTQRLIAAKGRLAKQGLTVPRLELVSAHMAMNLVINVRNALDGLPTPKIYGWLDSTVALHWISGNGQYKQFVANRLSKINQHPEIQWRHVPTLENPADLASRGGPTTELWRNGPDWLAEKEKWPPNPVTTSSAETEDEAKIIREVLGTVKMEPSADVFDHLLEKRNLHRALRVSAWVKRFVNNCKAKTKRTGLLTAEEVEEVKVWWIRRVQQRDTKMPYYEQTRRTLNLQVNAQGLVECRGRIQGRYPLYLPTDALLSRKLVEKVHCETLHGGVGLTMAAVRENYWVPKLRSLVKSVRKDCWGCKRFQATAVTSPPPGLLPQDRTTGEAAFEVVGEDFAGPIRYKQSPNREGKAYLALFACSLSRAVYLEILPNLETETFLPCLKRLIARRGRPRKIYSDNGGTFVKAAKWLRVIQADERLQGYLQDQEIQWQFNLSRAPWWGGQFERLIGVVKQAMYKTIGAATLKWDELCELFLDIEVQINRRPLSYIEDDVQLPTLTPSTFLFQRSNLLPEKEPWREGEKALRKRAKYIKSCKDNLWSRWSKEYLTALRERHNLNHRRTKFEVKRGDVVIIKADQKNRGKWPLAVVKETFPGRDGVVRAVRLQTGNGFLERPVQHLYPLELSCDKEPANSREGLNPETAAYRPRRAAAVAAAKNIKLIANSNENID